MKEATIAAAAFMLGMFAGVVGLVAIAHWVAVQWAP
jgi:hypothetical protein